MKIVCISDVHTYVDRLEIEECDMLLCAGDISYRGKLDEVKAFLDWFEIQPAKHKVFIAGNHDFLFENDPEVARALLKSYPDVIYLENSSVEIEGIKIWGSPWTPWFHSWAFNAYPEKLRSIWSQIPDDADIVITHGPPRGILDKVAYGNEEVGCPWLLKNLQRIKPKLHVFGHIHEGYGQKQEGKTLYVNAANCTLAYGRKPLNPVISVEYEKENNTPA